MSLLRLSTFLGVLVGLNVFLGLAMVAVIAANGANNPGVMRAQQQSAAAGASATAPLPDGSFAGLDLDGDGRISLAEAAGHAQVVTRFDRADRNRDGKLTKAEYDRLHKMPPSKPPARKGAREQIRRDAASAAAGG